MVICVIIIDKNGIKHFHEAKTSRLQARENPKLFHLENLPVATRYTNDNSGLMVTDTSNSVTVVDERRSVCKECVQNVAFPGGKIGNLRETLSLHKTDHLLFKDNIAISASFILFVH